MKIVYEPRGRAQEYSPLAANLYRGCDHGCPYCYAPAALHMDRNNFKNSMPRANIIPLLRQDAVELEAIKEKRPILLCFTCDPYQKLDETLKVTRSALEILLTHGLYVTILTKGGARSTRDFDILKQYKDQVTYGATLTFTDESDREYYEPRAAPTIERKEALRHAHLLGIRTMVSLEPVIKPDQTLRLIEETRDYVDHYKVGVWNHDRAAKNIDWHDFGSQAIKLLEQYHKSYYIKEDLKKHLMTCDRCNSIITVNNKMIDAFVYWNAGKNSGGVCEKCYDEIRDEDARIQEELEAASYLGV